MKFLVFPCNIFTVCIWCCFALFYHIVYVIQYFPNVNIPSKSYNLQEEQFWEASVSPMIFAYLRIPDGYLDSSVLLASETWDSCPWKCKNTQNLKTTVNLDLSLLSSYWWKVTAIQAAAPVYKGGTQFWNSILVGNCNNWGSVKMEKLDIELNVGKKATDSVN